MRYLPVAAFISLALSTPVNAKPVSVSQDWGASFYSGSQRLVLFAILKERPRGSLKFALSQFRELGLNNRQGWSRIDSRFTISPILTYEDNINGGTVKDSFLLGPFKFSVNEDDQAKSGVIVGSHISAGTDYAFGRRNLLETGLNLSYAYSPEHQIARKQVTASACVTSEVEAWTYSEACLVRSVLERDLGTSTATTASTGLIRVFSSSFGVHEAETSVSYEFREDYEKPYLGFDLTTARADVGALQFGVELSPEIEGENTTIYSIDAELSRPLLGRAGNISASFTHQKGSQFFGEDRSDDILSLAASRKITDYMTVGLSASRRDSSVELYDTKSVGFRVNISSWQPFK